MTEWMDREPEGDEEITRDKFGGIIGETKETPGMVRWYSKPTHYFLKRNGGPERRIFALGMEHRVGDEAYIFDTSIEFDDDEAPDLMDRIAEFNGLPTYSELVEVSLGLNALIQDLERTDRPEDRNLLKRLRAILEDAQNA